MKDNVKRNSKAFAQRSLVQNQIFSPNKELFIFGSHAKTIVCSNTKAIFKWLSKNQNQSNYSDQSQQGQTAQ